MGLNRDKSLFYYSVANMIDAGASTVTSMRQSFPRRFKPVASRLYESLDAGHNLSSSMAELDIFTHFECMLVSVGERSGMLPQVLKSLAEWFDNKNHIEKNLIIGFIYPLLVYYLAGPLLCIIEVVSNKMDHIGYSLLKLVLWWLLPIVLYYLWRLFSPVLRRNAIMGAIIDKIPFFGRLQFNSETSYFASALGMCLNSGMGIYNAMKLSCGVCINEMYRDHYTLVSQYVNERGCHLSEALSQLMTTKERESNILQLVTLGEETGTLPEQCTRLSQQFQEEYKHKLELLSRCLPVFFYLLIAFFLAIKIISIFSSYIGMLNSL